MASSLPTEPTATLSFQDDFGRKLCSFYLGIKVFLKYCSDEQLGQLKRSKVAGTYSPEGSIY